MLKLAFISFLLIVAGSSPATTISWSCDPMRENRTSDGSAMDAAFQFELGVFKDGFVPTASNASRWADHWVPARRTSYNPGTASFADQFVVEGNPAPFTVNARAYIRGFRDGATGSEWILFRNTAWNWPAPDPMNPLGREWNAADADQVVLGSVGAGGALMRSAAISSYTQWAALELAGVPLAGPEDDADHDGLANLLEFVFGTFPRNPGGSPPMPLSRPEIGGSRYLAISIPRRIDHLAELTVQVSGDLENWFSGPGHTILLEDRPTALVVRDVTPLEPAGGRRFMRLKAVLPVP